MSERESGAPDCWPEADSPEARSIPPVSRLHLIHMSAIWRAIKGYFFWTYERGSFHYDVMVTAILLFIFVTPRFVNFKDQPAQRPAHPMGITIFADGDRLIYQVEAAAVDARNEASLRASLLQAIEPVAGNVSLLETESVRDSSGRVVAFKAIVRK